MDFTLNASPTRQVWYVLDSLCPSHTDNKKRQSGNDWQVAPNISIITHFVDFYRRFPAVRLRNGSRKIVREAALSTCFLYVELKKRIVLCLV